MQGVCPCPWLRSSQCPPRRSVGGVGWSGWIQAYLSLQWGVSDACNESNGDFSALSTCLEEIGCRFRACEAPGLCGSQMRPDRSGGHPSLQSTLVAFLPLRLALNGITPHAYRLRAYGGSRDLAGGTAVIFSAVSGWQQGAAQLEVRDGSSHSCAAAGRIAWPQSSAFADLFSAQHMAEKFGS